MRVVSFYLARVSGSTAAAVGTEIEARSDLESAVRVASLRRMS